MSDWKKLVTSLEAKALDFGKLEEVLQENGQDYAIFTKSIRNVEGSLCFAVKEQSGSKLVVLGESGFLNDLTGKNPSVGNLSAKICEESAENCQILRKYISWTNPVALGRKGASIGLGDRLGVASPGHIHTVCNRPARPVLAQQSMRELDFTGRDYQQVLDAACWAVFREGYDKGFGADGDHLKNPKDVQMAIDLGFSMITLDCSEHIQNDVSAMSDDEVNEQYLQLDATTRNEYENVYLNKDFKLASGRVISYQPVELQRIILIYKQAVDFAEKIYKGHISQAGRQIDFEVSIDEVATTTAPGDHYFVAAEFKKLGVIANSLAPRFCGEFQKGIDYIGDVEQFESELKAHAEIADEFGHKLSIHSGSDKFSVFGIIGKYTKGRYHVKTAGTNWLEAIRVIAAVKPDLYREIHQFSLNNVDEALKFYKVTINFDKIPPLPTLSDEELPELMEKDDARQLIHICYGLILQAKDPFGNYRFCDGIYDTLEKNADKYSERLQIHIGKHLDLLGS